MTITTPLQQGRILIVEDDHSSRELLRMILEYDYHVETAHDGETALRLISEHDFDLVLLDIMMSGINGLEVLRTLRQDKRIQSLPVILVSALSDSDVMVEGLEVGANDYISKPIDPAILMARVRTQLKLKHLMDERNKHIEKLERAEQLRTQFVHIASHDLKNPLHNLSIANTLLKDEMGNNSRVKQILNVLDLTVENMHHIIEAFLDVVAIQSNTLELKPVVLSLSDVVNNIAMQYEIAAEEKDIRLHIGNHTGQVVADSARLVQIASNLVSNAIKYSPQGSVVTIWTETNDASLRLCVQDEGPGIPKKERHKLFTEFGKLSTRPTRNESRTGLGLWIVKHLIEKQGGTVGVNFPKAGGSIFWLELPTVASEPALAFAVEDSASL
ncbi:MAG: response regulator [Anaerolineae bacterium]|nr:response regulator [Anaerolineae bacterium]MDQ7037273.1 response regulator [Anaerolineae bacterium]